MDKKQISLSGRSLVLDQLSMRGHVPSQTEGARISVFNPSTRKLFQVEVRTTGKTSSKSRIFGFNYEWFISKKHETANASNLLYCFVLLAEINHTPRFFVVPSEVVADYATRQHKFWLAQPREKAVKNKDIRKFRIALDADSHGLPAATYEDNWKLLDE